MIEHTDTALQDLIAKIDESRLRFTQLPSLVDEVASLLGAFTRRRSPLDERFRRTSNTSNYAQHIIHVADDRGYSIVALVWSPGQYTPIHDHRGWCVVSVYQGCERETQYRLTGRDGEAKLLETRVRDIAAGEVVAMLPDGDDVHRVENCSLETTVSLHVYGVDMERFGTSIAQRFDSYPIQEPGR
jgi:3-mercaptopropionate dioxygenase